MSVQRRAFLESEHNRIGPPPGADSLARLRHVLKVYEDTDDSAELVTATRNVYAVEPWTGMTWGDLRTLARRLEDVSSLVGPASR